MLYLVIIFWTIFQKKTLLQTNFFSQIQFKILGNKSVVIFTKCRTKIRLIFVARYNELCVWQDDIIHNYQIYPGLWASKQIIICIRMLVIYTFKHTMFFCPHHLPKNLPTFIPRNNPKADGYMRPYRKRSRKLVHVTIHMQKQKLLLRYVENPLLSIRLKGNCSSSSVVHIFSTSLLAQH